MTSGQEEKLVERRVTYALELKGKLYIIEKVPARADEETATPTRGFRQADTDARSLRGEPHRARRSRQEILLIAECSLEGEWEGRIRYLPLR
jgi:hypothetical protein